jgi:flavin-dependent dehydrogenase
MRVSIVGDGIGGRTLYRLLKMQELDVDLYGQHNNTKCGIRPCGFGTSVSCINLLVKIGIPTKDYVLRRDDFILVDHRKIRSDAYWINKPRLLENITTAVLYDEPNLDEYDLVVDATGIARAYSQPVPESTDKIGVCYQLRVIVHEYVLPTFNFIKGGYLWTIPLGDKEAHVGGGSTILEAREIENLVYQHVQEMQPRSILCSCSEKIRLTGIIMPLVNGKVVTIGEAAGLVVPFGCAGIHTSIESAFILAEELRKNNLERYSKSIKRRFGWLNGSRNILDSIERGRVTYFSLGSCYQALRYEGLKPTVTDLIYIRKRILSANR